MLIFRNWIWVFSEPFAAWIDFYNLLYLLLEDIHFVYKFPNNINYFKQSGILTQVLNLMPLFLILAAFSSFF